MVQVDPMIQVDVTAQGGELASDLATPSGHAILADLGVQSVQEDMGPQTCPSIETYASLVTQCMTDELSHMIPRVSVGVVPMAAGPIVQAKEPHDLMTKGPMAKRHAVRDSMARGSTMRGPLGKDLAIRGHATRRPVARGSTSRGQIQPTRGSTAQGELAQETEDLPIQADPDPGEQASHALPTLGGPSQQATTGLPAQTGPAHEHHTTTWAHRVAGRPIGGPYIETTTSRYHSDILPPLFDDTVPLRNFIEENGMRTVAFLEEEVTRLATPFAHTLIRRFSVKRPSMDIIEQTYLAPGHFQGQVSIGARDHRSICIRFALEEDY